MHCRAEKTAEKTCTAVRRSVPPTAQWTTCEHFTLPDAPWSGVENTLPRGGGIYRSRHYREVPIVSLQTVRVVYVIHSLGRCGRCSACLSSLHYASSIGPWEGTQLGVLKSSAGK